MNRREKMVSGIDLSSSIGAEIGALCNPLVTKEECDVIYVDYADAASLRKHYAGNPSVEVDRIVETDAIWGKQTLLETLKRPVDFIVASHVIEHVPDLITWLRELRSALKSNGQVRLAIPDKRFTFDFLRRETELSDVLDSYISKARVPKPRAILDYYLNATQVDPLAAWRGELNESNVKRPNTFEPAMAMARDAAENSTYHDAHCWVFTPRSFANLMAQLCSLGLVEFACDRFFDTEVNTIEFFVSLRPEADTEKSVASWQRMASEATHPPKYASRLTQEPARLKSAVRAVCTRLLRSPVSNSR
ncbi:methyltransferase domain-containing protein [Paraburkholderia sp. BR10954]|uniref:class I SAM-dependent methyltransferase n=1 Tax=Paraburkholderia sp. BR10954 TaxID=3236995 RepID=UPI0034D2CBB1